MRKCTRDLKGRRRMAFSVCLNHVGRNHLTSEKNSAVCWQLGSLHFFTRDQLQHNQAAKFEGTKRLPNKPDSQLGVTSTRGGWWQRQGQSSEHFGIRVRGEEGPGKTRDAVGVGNIRGGTSLGGFV